jgi:hypothetical protein
MVHDAIQLERRDATFVPLRMCRHTLALELESGVAAGQVHGCLARDPGDPSQRFAYDGGVAYRDIVTYGRVAMRNDLNVSPYFRAARRRAGIAFALSTCTEPVPVSSFGAPAAMESPLMATA